MVRGPEPRLTAVPEIALVWVIFARERTFEETT